MKASFRWMQLISEDNHLPIDEGNVVDRIGKQIGAVEETVSLTSKYQNALVAKVIKKQKIEGSDHLNVLEIDDGSTNKTVDRLDNGLIQVVCGASNVEEGKLVVWLPPQSIVPSTFNKADPFTLSAKKIMDVLSNGMLASAKELDISDDHEGIVVLDEDAQPGQLLIDYLNLDDTICDIENKMFTHRPDLFGQLGIARELNGIYNRPFKSPSWYSLDSHLESKIKGKLKVQSLVSSQDCPRFMAVSIGNITLAPSPLWLQSYLSRAGLRPINNIVDITNYVMHVTGQPLHAYDFDKIAIDGQCEISVRYPAQDEQLTLLDHKVISLKPKDIVIANKVQAIGLGGIMGGGNSEIDKSTKNIVLECANFNMYATRRSSMEHGIFSEAVTRFTKGQSAWQCSVVLKYAYDLLKQICPTAEIVSEVVDYRSDSFLPNEEVIIGLDKIKSYLGRIVEEEQIVRLLTNVEFKVRVHRSNLYVIAPFWRTDIASGEDVIEEIARLIGFDNLPQSLPYRVISPPLSSDLLNLKMTIRHSLANAGSNEVLSYSFIDEKLVNATSKDVTNSYKIANALSPSLMYYRTNILSSLLALVHSNHKARYDRFSIFEIGKTHICDMVDESGLPTENEHLSLVFSAENKVASKFYSGSAYFQAKHYLTYLFCSLNFDIDKLVFKNLEELNTSTEFKMFANMFSHTNSSVVFYDQKLIGVIGECNQELKTLLKLPDFCSGFEIDLLTVAKLEKSTKSKYSKLSKYPNIVEDLTVTLPVDKTYDFVRDKLVDTVQKLIPNDVNFKFRLIDTFNKDLLSMESFNHWTFRLEFQSDIRTLVLKDIDELVGLISQNIENQ